MAEFSFLPADKGNEMQCAEPNVHYLPESLFVSIRQDNYSNQQNDSEKQHLPTAKPLLRNSQSG
jgi:hypothetical protein